MSAFIKQLFIQFKMDVRDKGTFLTLYVIPIIFFVIMGSVFSSINPEAKKTLVATMVIFSSTMGAVLGIPGPLVKMREAGVLRAYKVNGIPGWSILLVQGVSACMHLFIVAMIILVTAPLFFGADIPGSMAGFFVVLFILLFASISIGLLIGTLAKSQSVATMLAQAVFLPSLMLGGIMFPSSMLPKPLIWIGRFFPATYAMEAFKAIVFKRTANKISYLSMELMILIGVVAITVTTWRFVKNAKD